MKQRLSLFLFLQLSSTQTSETIQKLMIMKEQTDGADLPMNTINYENDDSKIDLSTFAKEERPPSYSTNRRRRILEAI